nr:hypothetical protein [Anaerolineae bacterium]
KASRAARWLVAQRNAFGGFNSTQDTVVGLQALTAFAATGRADVNLTVTVQAGEQRHKLVITPENYDVLQIMQLPVVRAKGLASLTLSPLKRGDSTGFSRSGRQCLIPIR